MILRAALDDDYLKHHAGSDRRDGDELVGRHRDGEKRPCVHACGGAAFVFKRVRVANIRARIGIAANEDRVAHGG